VWKQRERTEYKEMMTMAWNGWLADGPQRLSASHLLLAAYRYCPASELKIIQIQIKSARGVPRTAAGTRPGALPYWKQKRIRSWINFFFLSPGKMTSWRIRITEQGFIIVSFSDQRDEDTTKRKTTSVEEGALVNLLLPVVRRCSS
jgi:hypothetical protein